MTNWSLAWNKIVVYFISHQKNLLPENSSHQLSLRSVSFPKAGRSQSDYCETYFFTKHFLSGNILISCLTLFWQMFSFYTPWKHQKIFVKMRVCKMKTLARNWFKICLEIQFLQFLICTSLSYLPGIVFVKNKNLRGVLTIQSNI